MWIGCQDQPQPTVFYFSFSFSFVCWTAGGAHIDRGCRLTNGAYLVKRVWVACMEFDIFSVLNR
jgi:hypothetical protein